MSTLKQIIHLKQQGTVDELLNMDDQALELAVLPVDSKGRDHGRRGV